MYETLGNGLLNVTRQCSGFEVLLFLPSLTLNMMQLQRSAIIILHPTKEIRNTVSTVALYFPLSASVIILARTYIVSAFLILYLIF